MEFFTKKSFAVFAACIIPCATIFLLIKHTNIQQQDAPALNFAEITTPEVTHNKQLDVTVIVQAINPNNLSPNLSSLNFIKTTRFNKRYQAFRLQIKNESPDAYVFHPSKTTLPCVTRETIIASLNQSTVIVPFITGIGTPIVLITGMNFAFLPSLLVGAIVAAGTTLHLQSYKNKSTIAHYINNHVIDNKQEPVIAAYSSLDTLFFLKKKRDKRPISLQLKNTKTNTVLNFTIPTDNK